jgi:hypothetical protein
MALGNNGEAFSSFWHGRVLRALDQDGPGITFRHRAAFDMQLEAFELAWGQGRGAPPETHQLVRLSRIGYEAVASAVAFEVALLIARKLSLEGTPEAPLVLWLPHRMSAAGLVAGEWEAALMLVEHACGPLLAGPYGERLARAISELMPSDIFADPKVLAPIERAMRESNEGIG